MKKWIAVLWFLSSFCSIKAQDHAVDSLQKILTKASNDTTRVFTMLRISNCYYYSQSDSAMFYAQNAYNLAKKSQFKLGEAQSLAIIGGLFFETGNFVEALEAHLKTLQIFEEIKNTAGIAACYNNIAMVYQEQKYYDNATHYYFKAKDIFEAKKNEDDNLVKTFINIGYNYESMNRLDSALLYLNKAYELSLRIKDNEDIAIAHNNLGFIYYKLHKNDLALHHYRLSIPLARQFKDKQTLAHANYGMAEIFRETGKIDSAILFAKQSLSFYNEVSFVKGVSMASEFLSNLYATQQTMDSAYSYLKKTVTTKDSLFNEKIQAKVQALGFNEQLRQHAAQQRYRNNLRMYALIAGFIILALVATFLFRVRQLKREHLIRTKLSKDLHDDLGSTLNSIKVYTNLALIKKEEQHLQKIKESAQEAITGVRDIMWPTY
jgi:two-component system NtrC family sensor kinase